MKTKQEVYEFLNSLQWKRMTKQELSNELSKFFDKRMVLNDGTCEDCKDIDYSFITTTNTSVILWYFCLMQNLMTIRYGIQSGLK